MLEGVIRDVLYITIHGDAPSDMVGKLRCMQFWRRAVLQVNPSLSKIFKIVVLEATTGASGTWVNCLKQCLLEVGLDMTDATGMSGHEVKEMLNSSAWRLVSEHLHAHTLQNPKLSILPYLSRNGIHMCTY